MSPLPTPYRDAIARFRAELAAAPPPTADSAAAQRDPKRYLPDDGLQHAVDLALFLKRPLLLTGDPGTGKTALAESVALALNLGEVLQFNTKTTSTAKDLFYRYDAMRHFQDAQLGRERDVEEYIEYAALGKAIMMASPGDDAALPLPKGMQRKALPKASASQNARDLPSSVVLIDEIDKAPRDLPNDVLNEILEMSFVVTELREPRTYKAREGTKPFVILTSNSEKNLPDAFLRRCVFYHVPFPDDGRLKAIIRARLGLRDDGPAAERRLVRAAIADFRRVRSKEQLAKVPATAELLDWLQVLKQLGIELQGDQLTPNERAQVAYTYTVLAKTKDDLKLVTGG